MNKDEKKLVDECNNTKSCQLCTINSEDREKIMCNIESPQNSSVPPVKK